MQHIWLILCVLKTSDLSVRTHRAPWLTGFASVSSQKRPLTKEWWCPPQSVHPVTTQLLTVCFSQLLDNAFYLIGLDVQVAYVVTLSWLTVMYEVVLWLFCWLNNIGLYTGCGKKVDFWSFLLFSEQPFLILIYNITHSFTKIFYFIHIHSIIFHRPSKMWLCWRTTKLQTF